MKKYAKMVVISLIAGALSFSQGYAFADDFTSQVKSAQSSETSGSSVSLSETFGKLKSVGSSISSSVSNKVAALSGVGSSKNESASAGVSVSAGTSAYIGAPVYSRSRCTVVKIKDGEEKVCETAYISAAEGLKYFQ